jgi:hypothetical protein
MTFHISHYALCGNIPQSKHTIPAPSINVGTSHGPTHKPYSFGWTAPILTPSVKQLQSLLLRPDNPYTQIHAATTRYLYSMANGNSSWCQSPSQGINRGGTACQSQLYIAFVYVLLTTDLMMDYDKWQTRPLVREGAPNWQDCNFQYITNIWSWAPDGARHLGSCNVTLTLTRVSHNFAAIPARQDIAPALCHLAWLHPHLAQSGSIRPTASPAASSATSLQLDFSCIQKWPISGPQPAVQHGSRRQPPPYIIQKRPLSGPRLTQCRYRARAPYWWYSNKHKDSHSVKA